MEETAAVLNVSPFTVIRDWNFIKAWLSREMKIANPLRSENSHGLPEINGIPRGKNLTYPCYIGPKFLPVPLPISRIH